MPSLHVEALTTPSLVLTYHDPVRRILSPRKVRRP